MVVVVERTPVWKYHTHAVFRNMPRRSSIVAVSILWRMDFKANNGKIPMYLQPCCGVKYGQAGAHSCFRLTRSYRKIIMEWNEWSEPRVNTDTKDFLKAQGWWGNSMKSKRNDGTYQLLVPGLHMLNLIPTPEFQTALRFLQKAWKGERENKDQFWSYFCVFRMYITGRWSQHMNRKLKENTT